MKNFLIKENYNSVNLWNRINELNENQIVSIKNGLDWTLNNVPNAVLIGGTAVIHYITGARDFTPDLDFLVSDIGILKNKLSLDGFNYYPINSGQSLPLGITVDDFNTDYLDSSVGNVALNKLILHTPITTMIGGKTVKIVNPELLAIMKIEVGRDKDVNDGLKLLSSGKINKINYMKYLNQLKNNLNDYESLLSYRAFIV